MDVAEAAQRKALGHRVKAAVAEGIAAQQAPGGEQGPAQDPEAFNRLDRVGRAGRLVAAATGAARRDPALVAAQRRQDDPFHVERPFELPARASSSEAVTPGVPSRSTRSPSSKSWRGGSLSESAQKDSRNARFTLLRSTAPPTLRLTETPSLTS